MSWVLAIGLAAAAFAAMAFAFRLPRATWTSVLAALSLGLAGYVWQGNPGLPGAQKQPAPLVQGEGEAIAELRRAILPSRFESGSRFLITADALLRRDRYADAATMLRGAVRENPRDPEAWLALGNALVEAADGQVTPAAQFAYDRAEQLAPESPGVPFFTGIAQLQQGNVLEALQLWQRALDRTAEGSEERQQIQLRLDRLTAVLRQMVEQQSQQPAP